MGNLVVALIMGTVPMPVYGAEPVNAGIVYDELTDESTITEEQEAGLQVVEEEIPFIDEEDLTVDEPESIVSEEELKDGGSSGSAVIEIPETDSEATSWVSTNSLPTVSGNYKLYTDVSLSGCWVVMKNNISIDLNGHTISKGSIQVNHENHDAMISIFEGGSLTINDSRTGGEINGSGVDNWKDVGVTVGCYGTFTMNGGTITGNDNNMHDGGGVCVVENGTFTMNGGTITHNFTGENGGGVCVKNGTFTMNGGTIFENDAEKGDGAGVYVDNGTFTMTGGTISNNTVRVYGNGNGGGVCVENGTFTMTGGTINNNNSQWSGGGVCVNDGTFHLGGDAKIIGNKALAKESFGGGVYVGGGIFTMSGNSAITGNEANCGGGIDVESNTRISMTDKARVEGNRATGEHQLGGGVRVHNSTFEMSGNAMISNNETDYYGGGLHVEGSEVNMTGGTITGNKAKKGGGVHVTAESKFMMTGGTISGNTADNSGGGLCVNNNSLLTMADGSVKDNICSSGAGGVKVNNGSFILKGGSIENNKGTYGGGIRLEESTLNMSGAEIKGNEATEGGGGGIYAGENSVLTVSGGSIFGNSSRNYWSGAVYYDKDIRFTVSGNPKIYDNYKGGTLSDNGLYTDGIRADIHTGNESEGYKVVTVIGELKDGAKIGLCGKDGVVVAEGGNGYTLTDSDGDRFFSDYYENGRHWETEVDNGKLYMGLPMKYVTVSPNNIPDQTYTGSPIEPDVKVMYDKKELEKDVQYIVSYANNTDTGEATVTIKAKHMDDNGSAKGHFVGSISKKFNIKKAKFTDTDISRAPKYGMSDSVDLSRFCKDGATVNLGSVKGDNSILESYALTDKVLGFKIKNDYKLTGKYAVITIPVTGAKNYEDCTIKVTITVSPDESCTELADDISKEDGNKNTPVSANTVNKEDGGTETSITVGGEEVSKVTVDKDGKVSESTRIWVSGIEKGYKYTGEAIKPEIHVYDGTKKLTAGTDYSLSYSSNKAVGNDTAKLKISFKGSYAGTASQTLRFTIIPAELDKDVTVTPVSIAASKNEQKPVPVITMKETGKKLSSGIFKYEYDRPVKAAGSYTVTIKPKNNNKNFTESVTTTITVTDNTHLLSKTTVKLAQGKAKNFTYTGNELPVEADRAGRYILTIKSGKNTVTLKEGTDYDVTYTNNINPGTVLVTFKGKGDYIGTRTTTFKIVKGRSLKDKEVKVAFADGKDQAPYAKGGAKPGIKITDNGTELTLGKDYTVSYSKNRAVTSEKTAIAKVKGKGNYKDTVELYFAVTTRNINDLTIVVNDKIRSNKADGYKNPKVVITDTDGKKLKAKTDFEIADDYTAPDANGKVTVSIKGNGNYYGTYQASYRYIDADKNIGKVQAKAKIADQTYTGKEIYINNDVLNKILFSGVTPLIKDEDFEVVSYEKNKDKGTAKINLKGINAYGGTRTLTFKIKAKKGDYKGTLKGGEWK